MLRAPLGRVALAPVPVASRRPPPEPDERRAGGSSGPSAPGHHFGVIPVAGGSAASGGASFGTAGPVVEVVVPIRQDEPEITSSGGAVPDIQRQAPPAPPPAATPPTLTLAPTSLTRGATLNATVNVTPTAGQSIQVVGWAYTTAAGETVTRPASDAGFQTGWSGPVALSGTMTLRYTATPTGGQAGAPQAITAPVTVTDRTGGTWAAAPTLGAEAAFAGQPSPPRLYRQLGRHNVPAPTLPTPTTKAIPAGPNAGFTYVESITAGTYASNPVIHPDLTNVASRFNKFHVNPGRLYIVKGTVRTVVPPADYSNLQVTGGTLSFDALPNWEAFYKKHRLMVVTATSGARSAVLQDALWGLDANTQDAGLTIKDEPAVRAALGVGPNDGYRVGGATTGTFNGNTLMQAAAILSGTRSHEYAHGTHSHRANFTAMMRALDPQKISERSVSTPATAVNFQQQIRDLWTEILKPDHELVDEVESAKQRVFVAKAGAGMAGINTDPATGNFLGNVWDITGDQPMT